MKRGVEKLVVGSLVMTSLGMMVSILGMTLGASASPVIQYGLLLGALPIIIAGVFVAFYAWLVERKVPMR
jgi:hypothetical protein